MTRETARARTATSVDIEDVTVRYGETTAVRGVSLGVRPQEVLALVGPSGCGKTSLLKAIAGLEPIAGGRIAFDGKRIDGVAPHRRKVGMVFQNYALFPHKRVHENIGFGLRMLGIPDPGGQHVAQVLDLLRIGHLARAWPDQLSGGQQQRVALARTLVVEPQVLLLDEPLSALDRQLRDDMRVELRALAKAAGITTILVTHDQDEAMAMADRVAVMQGGRLEQVGTPEDLYTTPQTAFVAGFLGRINRFRATCDGVDGDRLRVRLDGGGMLHLPVPAPAPPRGAALQVLARAEALSLAGADLGHLPATMRDRQFMGNSVELYLATDAGDMVRLVCDPGADIPPAGARRHLRIAPPGVFVFPA